jgi:hypothetical protein
MFYTVSVTGHKIANMIETVFYEEVATLSLLAAL